jgi:uncharacterized protein YdeI (YjbR/CyaY-like superfamily)
MGKKGIAGGTVHRIPSDLQKALVSTPKAHTAWNNLTPLARNEWICWVISAKKRETRHDRIERALNDLAAGKRRPCCWIGCIHRKDKPMSASQKFILGK